MGVPLLYSFLIEKNKNESKFSKIDHSKIIIDGTSISYYLLIHSIKDARIDPENQYQIYFDYVMNFFQKFLDHKVDIFVFLNGVWKEQNLDSQIKIISERIKDPPSDERPIDYVYYKTFKHDIVVEVLKKLNIKFIVCPFHAADVIATMAKILNYPVLTANADLFLFGTDCIFFRNLLFKDYSKNGQLNMSFLCKILRPREFVKMYSGLDIFCLPLLSVLLNDDHFPDDNLYEIFLPDPLPSKNFDKFNSLPHYKIEEAFKWLSNHTLDSAVEIILEKIKSKSLESSTTYIANIINDYTAMSTYMLNYFTNLQSFTINQAKISKMKGKFLNYKMKSENDNDNNESVEKFDSISKTLSMIPDWLIHEIINGNINPSIIDLFQHEAYTVWPHMENLNQPSIYEMSIPLIIFVYRLLLPYINQNETSSLKLFIRKDSTIECREILVEKYPLRLEDIRSNMKIKLEIINDILLGIKEAHVLHNLPQDWRLYFATIVFWMKQIVEPKKNEHHSYTLVLSMFFTILESKIKNSKDQLFDVRFVEEIERLSSEGNVEEKDLSFIAALEEITSQDLKEVADWILSMFENKKNITEITIDTYHIFMQFQCCLEHSKIINSILGFPYDDAVINKVIHVPLIKNVFSEISSETINPNNCIEKKLKNVPSILKVFQILEKIFNTFM